MVVIVAVVMINLGFWQLARHDERQLENAVGDSRYEAEPQPLSELLEGAGADVESLQYRRAIVTGVYRADDEVLVRNQVHLGNAGFDVITPLWDGSDRAVMVNRGWVPLVLDSVPVEQAAPPSGETTEVGWIDLSQDRPPLGREDPPEGRLEVVNRVDIDRLQAQITYPLAPVYVNLTGEQGSELPVPPDRPVFDDNGPHLAYAIQWFAFAVIGVFGYAFLIRRTLRRSG